MNVELIYSTLAEIIGHRENVKITVELERIESFDEETKKNID